MFVCSVVVHNNKQDTSDDDMMMILLLLLLLVHGGMTPWPCLPPHHLQAFAETENTTLTDSGKIQRKKPDADHCHTQIFLTICRVFLP
jgi:hypothetical protein